MESHLRGIRLAAMGIGVNLALAALKIATGIAGNSHALIADGIESVSDVVSSVVVMGGLKASAIPADEDHPFGHGKAEPMAGTVVALMLLGATAWIGWSSVLQIANPHDSPAWYTLAVLALVILVKEAISRRILRVGHDLGSTAIRGEAWHHRSDALTSFAAFVGITIALVGGDGFEAADDWAALAACGVMAFNGVRLLQAALDDLMDRSASPELLAQVRALAAGVDGVVSIEKCRIRRVGLGHSMDIHVTVDGGTTVRRGHNIAHAVKDRLILSDHRITDVTVHIEPDDLRQSR
ncbi:MAG: cation diffusion facilitator family transporter [Limisphaerales bacterium]